MEINFVIHMLEFITWKSNYRSNTLVREISIGLDSTWISKWILNFNVFTRLYTWTHNYRLISAIHFYHIFIGNSEEPARIRLLSLRFFFAGLRCSSSSLVYVMKSRFCCLFTRSSSLVVRYLITSSLVTFEGSKKKSHKSPKRCKVESIEEVCHKLWGGEINLISTLDQCESTKKSFVMNRVKGHVMNEFSV